MPTLIYSMISFVYMLIIPCVVAYISLPFVIKLLPSIVVQGTFLNLICSPRRVARLHKPKEAWKLDGVIHHYVSSSGTRLGVWHFMPTADDAADEATKPEESLASASKVVIYCHGNAGHRCFGHRRYLYKMLRSNGFHVIAFDYRGYGDSEGWPSEEGVVEDTVAVYKWAVEQILHPECEVLVWGHSLGTAIATQAMLRIQVEEFAQNPSGVILEAPFTCAVEAMTEYPLSKYIAKIYPGKLMHRVMENALSAKRISFPTAITLPKLSSNILILHAQDDRKVHFKLGKKLFDEMKNNLDSSSSNVTFAAFKASHGFGHNGIWQYPDLAALIGNLSDQSNSGGFVEIEL